MKMCYNFCSGKLLFSDRDLMPGEIIFQLVLCSILIRTRIDFMHGNIDKRSAKCQLSSFHGLLQKPTQWRREKGDS